MNNHFAVFDLYLLNKKYFKLISLTTGFFLILSIIYSLIAPPLYKSYISIYPTREESPLPTISGLNNVSSAFGLNFGAETNGYNIPDIINSRKLKKAIVSQKWLSNKFDDEINLIDYWQIGKPGLLSIFFEPKE